jgi:hypothetical protein
VSISSKKTYQQQKWDYTNDWRLTILDYFLRVFHSMDVAGIASTEFVGCNPDEKDYPKTITKVRQVLTSMGLWKIELSSVSMDDPEQTWGGATFC